MRDIVTRFFAVIFNGMHLLHAHAVALLYDDQNGSHGPLACVADLPHDNAGLQTFAKDLRVNRRSGKVIFHARISSSTPVVHLKRHYYPEIGTMGRLTMKLLNKHGIWFTPQ